MKYTFNIAVIMLPFFASLAQSPEKVDSLNYETQRKVVNDLLEERTAKFGEYDVSLQQRTGIFGMYKRKKDMQTSIDILKQIVLTDNNIFIETKKLLALKDFESSRYQRMAQEYDAQALAYMKTITKLQQENEKLKTSIDGLKTEDQDNNILLYLCILIILGLAGYVIIDIRKKNAQKKLTKL